MDAEHCLCVAPSPDWKGTSGQEKPVTPTGATAPNRRCLDVFVRVSALVSGDAHAHGHGDENMDVVRPG